MRLTSVERGILELVTEYVQAAATIVAQLPSASHEARVTLFRGLAKSCPDHPEVWARGAAIIVELAPAGADRVGLIAAAMEAAYELGVEGGGFGS